MRKSLRRRLMAAGLLLALTAAPGNAQTGPTGTSDPTCTTCRPSGWQRFRLGFQNRFRGSSETYEASPFGQSVTEIVTMQVANGVAARMMLYNYDFEHGGDKLNLRGQDQLRHMAEWLTTQSFPLVVERTPQRPALAESRRLAVLKELAAAKIDVSPERVIVGPAPLGQLRGDEALIHYDLFIRYTTNGYPAVPQGSSSSGSSGGSGGANVGTKQ